MNLCETVRLKIKIYEADCYPTIALLKADETMLINGLLHANSRISTAKLILHCFDLKACLTRNDLLNMLLRHPTFVADLSKLDEKAIKINAANVKEMQVCYHINDGLNWLHDVGLCYTDITNPPIAIEKLSKVGKKVLNVLKLQADLYAAIDFLASTSRCRYDSAAEEKLNCTLFGHPEWTEPKWLDKHLKWLSGVYTYNKNNASNACKLGIEFNLSAMLQCLCLVKSWQTLVNDWLAKIDVDYWKQIKKKTCV